MTFPQAPDDPAGAGLFADTGEAFPWGGGGLSLGVHIDELDSDRNRKGYAGGAFLSGGKALVSDTSEGCAEKLRPTPYS
jgi:hypothetical protein